MPLRWVRIKYNKILANMYWDGKLNFTKPVKFILSFHGLPSHPYQLNPSPLHNYLEEGFVMVYPEYIGTWGSYGKNTLQSCVETALSIIRFVSKGKAMDILDKTKLSWKPHSITLLGGSFGGSVALVAGAKSNFVKNIIAVAPPTDYQSHNKKYKEENLSGTWRILTEGFKNLWRLDKKFFDKLVRGEIDINPVDYVEELQNKNVLLIHGSNDSSVSVKRSIELFHQLRGGNGNHKLIILKNESHKGNDIIGREDLFPQIISWLRK